MTLLATPAVSEAYLADQIADEMKIAQMLGYRCLERPTAIAGSPCVIWGIRGDFKPLWPGSNGRSFLPAWRRTWGAAGELIAMCNMNMVVCDKRVAVRAGALVTQAEVADHPSKDDAIRYAICKVAIAYLDAARKGAMP